MREYQPFQSLESVIRSGLCDELLIDDDEVVKENYLFFSGHEMDQLERMIKLEEKIIKNLGFGFISHLGVFHSHSPFFY